MFAYPMPTTMKFISVKEFAQIHDIAERTARNYCAQGKIPGAQVIGKTWSIPDDATPPNKGKSGKKVSPLLQALREQKDGKMKGGIYHRTQIELTYNSNHIEGSRLTIEQTRNIFETNTIGATENAIKVDDIIETTNHFRCIDYIIDHACDPITEQMIKHLHLLLKSGTSDASKPWFAVGKYKLLPNEVGGRETTAPEDTGKEIRTLLKEYNKKSNIRLEDILDFHQRFEKIHPFQDGNGRVGRLIMFKECLRHGIVPFVITEELKMFYYRGLQEWTHVTGYLTDTCLTAQDNYKRILKYFRIKH